MSSSCKIEGCGKPVENSDLGLCASHSRQARKGKVVAVIGNAPRIKAQSEAMAKKINEYSRRKKEFFKNPENRICRVCGKPGADTIHHARGKVGFADDQARLEGVTLLNDRRFWVPIHSFNINLKFGTSCHSYIEDHPEFAREIGVTKSRLSKK